MRLNNESRSDPLASFAKEAYLRYDMQECPGIHRTQIRFITTNLSGGGAEKALIKLVSILTQRGRSASLTLLEKRIEHEVPHDVCVTALSTKVGHGWLGKRRLARHLIRHLVQQGKPAGLVVSTLPFADEVVALAGIPNHWIRIANTLSAEIDRLRAVSPAKARRRRARYCKIYGSRPLIAVSAGVAEDLRRCFDLSVPITNIPNPFDFEAIRTAARQSCPDRPHGRYVIHVGRLAPQKRHDLLLDAWAELDCPHILVLLTKPAPLLSAMITERGLSDRVRVAGFQPNPYPWIAGADALILSSDHEGLPNVLIEAMICGTPVVSTDCPSGPREILGDRFPKALVPCGNAPALCQAIATCLANPPSVSSADLTAYEAHRVAAAYEQLADNLKETV